MQLETQQPSIDEKCSTDNKAPFTLLLKRLLGYFKISPRELGPISRRVFDYH